MKKLSSGRYQDTHAGVSMLLCKVSKPYTNLDGYKSHHTGWGFILEGDTNAELSPAYSSRKQARSVAVREIDRRQANTTTTK